MRSHGVKQIVWPVRGWQSFGPGRVGGHPRITVSSHYQCQNAPVPKKSPKTTHARRYWVDPEAGPGWIMNPKITVSSAMRWPEFTSGRCDDDTSPLGR